MNFFSGSRLQAHVYCRGLPKCLPRSAPRSFSGPLQGSGDLDVDPHRSTSRPFCSLCSHKVYCYTTRLCSSCFSSTSTLPPDTTPRRCDRSLQRSTFQVRTNDPLPCQRLGRLVAPFACCLRAPWFTSCAAFGAPDAGLGFSEASSL